MSHVEKLGFIPQALIAGAVFAVAWGVMMWLFFAAAHFFRPTLFFAIPTAFIAVAAALCGLAFGVVMAGFARYRARRLHLSV